MTPGLVGTPGLVRTPGLVGPARSQLPALKLVQSSHTMRRLANGLLTLLVLTFIGLAFVPWQQSARGTGKVCAYVPQERQQTVTSPVKGVVASIAKNIVEGVRVQQGDFILEIEPNAANLVEQLKAQVQNLETKYATAQTKAEVYGQNVIDFDAARQAAIKAADELVEAAKSKWDAKKKLLAGYEAKELQARLNHQRQTGLMEKGLTAPKEVEQVRKDWEVARSDLESAHLDAAAGEQEWQAKISEREQKQREARTKVDYSRAMQQDSLGSAATIEKEKRDLQIKLAELDRLVIHAPRDGSIFRMPVYERGQMLKEGDPLFTIVPDTTEQVVELWISGNDTPLVRVGDHVRLQFEGWPAVQFAGWPSVAVGTFGGRIVSIDASDDGTGKFRALVKQDGEQQWPSDRYLRQGVRANGWVMLSQVPLGYELWRQLNGFPPVISKDEPGSDKKDEKKKVPLPK